jgi:CrcB protein
LTYFWIALGSGLGGAARYALQGFAARSFGATFPWGTLMVNVIGSTFIGWFAGMTSPDGRWLLSTPARQFVMVGICGGFTTFSSFSLETLNLARGGEPLHAAGYVIASMAMCLAGVWLGWALSMEMSR